MKKVLALSLALIGGMSLNAQATESVDFSKLSAQDKEAIGQIAKEYLIANPEVLVDVSKALQAKNQVSQEEQIRQAAKKAIEQKDAVLNDKDTPFIGPKDAKIAIVEFFDYNCVYCSKVSSELKAVIKNNPDIKFVFKDMPIFASRFPTSKLAVQLGNKVYQEKGSVAYVKYHDAIYDTKHFEGELTVADVENAAKLVGVDPKIEQDAYQENITKNMKLASDLAIHGTPAFIFMPTSGQTDDNTLVLMQAISKEQMQDIINQVKEKINVPVAVNAVSSEVEKTTTKAVKK